MRPVAFLLLVVVASLARPAAAIDWDLATAYPPGSLQTRNQLRFAQGVTRATQGLLTIRVRPSGQPIPGPLILDAVASGETAMGERLLSAEGEKEPLLALDALPFLARSPAEADALWQASREAIEALLAERGILLLYAVPWPAQGLFSTRPLDGAADLQGLRIRAHDAPTRRLAKDTGMLPLPVERPQILDALASGEIEALLSSASTGYEVRIWEIASHFYALGASFPRSHVMVNRAAFESLPSYMQGILREEAARIEAWGANESRSLDRWHQEQLVAQGMQAGPPSAELEAALTAEAEPLLADWLERAGPEGRAIIDRYRALLADGRAEP